MIAPLSGIDPDLEREVRAQHLAQGEELAPDAYPLLDNHSAAFFFEFMPRPANALPMEYVRVPVPSRALLTSEEGRAERLELVNFIASWNFAWEAGHRRQELNEEKLPAALSWLSKRPGVNLCLLADEGQRSAYDMYRSLYHLLPRATLERHGLPLLRKGHWPFTITDVWADRILPADAHQRLSRALAAHVWPILSPRSRINAFSDDDSLRLLAHNLDFWLPHIDHVVAERLSQLPRVDVESDEQMRLLEQLRAEAPSDMAINRPLKGGYVWMGEQEAREATQEMVDAADRNGQLRGIIDAIRSHRVEEDFSDRWSCAREDFERKLYAKRHRVKTTFVELNDTVPVHGREAEVHENLLWEGFLAVVDPRERRIVVCLRNGLTRVGDIASDLGYANHSPVSKALARIRRRAERFLSD